MISVLTGKSQDVPFLGFLLERLFNEVEPGVLYVVSTPIGNLRDISLRALDILRHVDFIAAEDTRTSKILLNHYDISTPLESYHDYNKEKVTPSILSRLKARAAAAVISEAGTPGISDPAYYIVSRAIEEGIGVKAIPGATAFVPALIISGLPTDRFVFEGFLPVKKGRQTRLKQLSVEPRTMILYESAKRIVKTLGDLFRVCGERRVAVSRELTKMYEEVIYGSFEQLIERFEKSPCRGEVVLVIEGLTRRISSARRKERYETRDTP